LAKRPWESALGASVNILSVLNLYVYRYFSVTRLEMRTHIGLRNAFTGKIHFLQNFPGVEIRRDIETPLTKVDELEV
jgi:hypothetical protein